MLVSLGLLNFAIEIGVAEGDFSFYLLDRWPGTCWQVDPWRQMDAAEYVDVCNLADPEQERRFELVTKRAAKYGRRAAPMRMTSEEASSKFIDGVFDFVYIDANHKYESISQDLKLWWPKVRWGGVFAGHDYLDGVIASGTYGVKTAVDEFVRREFPDTAPLGVTAEKDYPSWWVRKL